MQAVAGSEPLKKTIHYVRHGESKVNAAQQVAWEKGLTDGLEPAKARDLIYAIMNSPEHFDTGLSIKGQEQAAQLALKGAAGGRPTKDEVELIVASSLSRAVHTAALVFPQKDGYVRPIVCIDDVREFAGPPTSEKRHAASEMVPHFVETIGLDPSEVDISHVPEFDHVWRPAEESGKSAFGRADRALAYLMQRPERVIACVGHTSFLRQCMLGRRNKSVVVEAPEDEKTKLWKDFENCEVRSVEMWIGPHDKKFHVRPIRTMSSKL